MLRAGSHLLPSAPLRTNHFCLDAGARYQWLFEAIRQPAPCVETQPELTPMQTVPVPMGQVNSPTLTLAVNLASEVIDKECARSRQLGR